MLTYKKKLEFIAHIAPLAQASQAKFGVPASITIAQAILESAWGQSQLTLKANNFFGIKARAGEDYCEFQTTEFRNGHAVRELARFRKFRSAQESFDRHAQLLSSLGRYQAAMAAASDPLVFASRLQQCGYATDPMYPVKLADLIGDFNLTQYDAARAKAGRTAQPAAAEREAS
jgi:flagellum-specific peptidoglycan hydrolase FlgJ